MSVLSPDPSEYLARARGDLRMGVPVALSNAGHVVLVMAAETLTKRRFAALGQDAHLAITVRRAETLKARAYDGDLARIHLPADADASWVQSVADPATDLSKPMKGPFRSLRDGDPSLARAALQLAKDARLLPAVLIYPVKTLPEGITLLALDEITDLLGHGSPLSSLVSARVPLSVSEAGRLHVFRPEDGGEEHYAVEIGIPDRNAPVLARLHSACFTGDLLGSLKCDCGPQLRGALSQMGSEGAGILLYLNQEGRGIGLANKMRAYALQDQGLDTVEANAAQGLPVDSREYGVGANMLADLGVSRFRIMTNNPAKLTGLDGYGLEIVDRVPVEIASNPENEKYLETKRTRMGHALSEAADTEAD